MNSESTVPPQASETLWYYADANNQPVGPLSLAGLEQFAATGLIHARTKVIESGGTVWRRFAEITSFRIPPQYVRWFYADAHNEPAGPLPMEELQRLAASGVISPKTQIIEEGGNAWRTFAEIAPKSFPGLTPAPQWQMVISAVLRELEEFLIWMWRGVAGIAAELSKAASLPQTNTPPNSKRRLLTILALIFLFPVGLWMLWRNNDFSKRTKQIVTALFAVMFLPLLFSHLALVLFFPVGLWMLWRNNDFSKRTKMGVTAIFVLLFFAITAKNDTKKVGNGSEAGAPRAGTLGMTPEQFRVAFNARVSELDMGRRFEIKEFVVKTGSEKSTLSYTFSDYLGLGGDVDRASHEIDFLVVMVTAESTNGNEALDSLRLSAAIIAVVSPSTNAKGRGEVVFNLYDDAGHNKGKSYAAVEGNLKLECLRTEGVFMFSISPRKN